MQEDQKKKDEELKQILNHKLQLNEMPNFIKKKPKEKIADKKVISTEYDNQNDNMVHKSTNSSSCNSINTNNINNNTKDKVNITYNLKQKPVKNVEAIKVNIAKKNEMIDK